MKHTFRDPLTGSVVSGEVNDIVAKIVRIRTSRGFAADRGPVYAEVIAAVQKKNIKVGKTRKSVSFKEAMQAGKAALKIIKGVMVGNKEMERRYNICKSCPAISETSECFRCNRAKFLAEITHTLKGVFGEDVKLPGESKKFSCGVCGCSLSMLLPTKTADLHQDTPEQAERRPDFCWMSKGGPNYVES